MNRVKLPEDYSEREFQSEVIKLAKQGNWLVYHTKNSKGSQPGFPDLVLVRDGRLIFMELKTERGRVSADQKKWLTELRVLTSNGDDVLADVFRPSDLSRITYFLTPSRKQ